MAVCFFFSYCHLLMIFVTFCFGLTNANNPTTVSKSYNLRATATTHTGTLIPPHGGPSSVVRAEVEVLMPSRPPPRARAPFGDPHRDGLVRASSILMEYDEDITKYITSRKRHQYRPHGHHRHSNVLSDDYSVIPPEINEPPDTKPLPKVTAPAEPQKVDPDVTKAPETEEPGDKIGAIDETKNVEKLNGPKNDSWISLHSPVRIYVPVRYHEKNSSSAAGSRRCVRCPSRITLFASRGRTDVQVPVPAITVCPRMAREKGQMNIAVATGPKPGRRVSEGNHAMELLVWKSGGSVYTCQYMLNVVVRKCEFVASPGHGHVNCSEGNIWGSRCKFSCSSNHILRGHRVVSCEDFAGNMLWSAPFPVCKRMEKLPVTTTPSCHKPQSPLDGTVVCDSNSKNAYSDGSVCQFFCHSGFLLKETSSNHSLVVCRNGHWAPFNKVTCVATYCSSPRFPKHGSLSCDSKNAKLASFKTKYRNGTTCHIQCNAGFVVTASELPLNKIRCIAPLWNDSFMPECKQQLVPYADPEDCLDMILIANRRGFAKLRNLSFYVRDEFGYELQMHSKCTYTGKVAIGHYINHCVAHYHEFNSSSECIYAVTVKENSCSPPPIINNAVIDCTNYFNTSYSRHTRCNYTCQEGFVAPVKHRNLMSKKCTSKLKWKPSGIPSCISPIQPKPRLGHCTSKVLYLDRNSSFANHKYPKFKSSMKGSKMKVICSLNKTLSIGNYTNRCEAFDTQLEVNSSCEYNIVVKERTCSPLDTILNGSIICSQHLTKHVTLGTECEYKCSEGFVIQSSSLKFSFVRCNEDGTWNSSISPACVVQGFPIPTNKSCEDFIVQLDDPSKFTLSSQNFTSSDGDTLEAKCELQNMTGYGNYHTNCSAYDPEMRTKGFCDFRVELQPPDNVPEFDEGIECGALLAPKNGFITCSQNNTFGQCIVKCNPGYDISSEFKVLRKGFVDCDNTDGLWDFERNYNTSQLPDCLGRLANTSVAVWLSFRAAVEQCSNGFEAKLKDQLIGLNAEMCTVIDCELLVSVNCSEDTLLPGNKFILHVKWTLQSAYNPDDYNSTSIPDWETHMENILMATQKAITSDQSFHNELLQSGIFLHKDSFRRGHFVLICDERGYSVEQATNKCVECPVNSMEMDGSCVKCPANFYQHVPGQTKCDKCPDLDITFDENIRAICSGA